MEQCKALLALIANEKVLLCLLEMLLFMLMFVGFAVMNRLPPSPQSAAIIVALFSAIIIRNGDLESLMLSGQQLIIAKATLLKDYPRIWLAIPQFLRTIILKSATKSAATNAPGVATSLAPIHTLRMLCAREAS